MNQSPRIFISHSHQDKIVAKALLDLIQISLENHATDIRCTSIPQNELKLGEDVFDTLNLEIKAAQVILGLISPESLKSLYVLHELNTALSFGIPIFLLRIRGAKHSDLPHPLRKLISREISHPPVCKRCVEDIGEILSLQLIGESDQIDKASSDLARRANLGY